MATYKYPAYIEQNNSTEFDKAHSPGGHVPHSGIYRCLGCGREVVAEEARQFPTQNHHQHSNVLVPIRWQLIVYADHQPK
jgi:hypothetical protein